MRARNNIDGDNLVPFELINIGVEVGTLPVGLTGSQQATEVVVNVFLGGIVDIRGGSSVDKIVEVIIEYKRVPSLVYGT